MAQSQNINNYQGKKALVIGAGRSGRAAVRLLHALGATTTLLESNAISEEFKLEMQKLGIECILDGMKEQYFTNVDLIIPSPGIPIAKIRPLLADNTEAEILAEMEFAWRQLQGEAVLAVTGSSGKTTTVSLAAAMLEAEGKKVFLGGNIGTPLSEYVLENMQDTQRADVLVLEVSSFQLQGCTKFAPQVAMLMNITENHLDYHADLQEYTDAKMQLFAEQNADNVAIFHESLEGLTQNYKIPARKLFFAKDMGNFPERQLFGEHNGTNIEAAWRACEVLGVQLKNAQKAVSEFQPLPHRLEKVRELHDVLYVNDSKCTTVDAMRVALQSFDMPIILLCGGKFKGGDLHSLQGIIKEKVTNVVMFGDSREYFEKAWEEIVPMQWFATLREAVQHAQGLASAQQVVLMAPATASFDLYENYIQRGEDFKAIVRALV